MNRPISEAHIEARRGELIVELFLQDIGAAFVAKPGSDLGIDFLVAFSNRLGGLSLSAVEVKVTGRPVAKTFPLQVEWYARLAHANVPALLLVVDVKQNRLYHAWPNAETLAKYAGNRTIPVPVAEIDDTVKDSIRERLASVRNWPSRIAGTPLEHRETGEVPEPDSGSVNLEEAWEMEYWSKKLGCTPEQLREAVKNVGHRAEDVIVELHRLSA